MRRTIRSLVVVTFLGLLLSQVFRRSGRPGHRSHSSHDWSGRRWGRGYRR